MLSPEVKQELLKGIEKVSPETVGSMVVLLEELRAGAKASGKPYEKIDEVIEAAREYHELLVELRATMNIVGYTQMARLITMMDVGLLAFKDMITKDDFSARDLAVGALIEGGEILASSEYTLLPLEDMKVLVARHAMRLVRFLWEVQEAFGEPLDGDPDPAVGIRALVSYLLDDKVRIAQRVVVLAQTYRWVISARIYALFGTQRPAKRK